MPGLRCEIAKEVSMEDGSDVPGVGHRDLDVAIEEGRSTFGANVG